MKNLRIFLVVIGFLCIIFYFIHSEEYYVNDFGYFVDIPEGWKVVDADNPALISFGSKDGSAVFMIFAFKGDEFNSAEEISNFITKRLNASVEEEKFNYSGNDSIFSFLSFNSGNIPVKGYSVFINNFEIDYALIAFSIVNKYEENYDFLISVLNSFAIDKKNRKTPGPVSEYYYRKQKPDRNPDKIVVNGNTINVVVDINEIKATIAIVENEARILSTYQGNKNDVYKPWKRYYNVIYRDNYSRLKYITDQIIDKLDLKNKSDIEKVDILLKWIQNFEYPKEKIKADLMTPLASIYTYDGDCDSRVLLLSIILDQIGIDSVVLVSQEFNHSVIGINIKGNGAKFSYDGKEYLYAELTKSVDIGVMPDEMTDFSKWIPMKLGYN